MFSIYYIPSNKDNNKSKIWAFQGIPQAQFDTSHHLFFLHLYLGIVIISSFIFLMRIAFNTVTTDVKQLQEELFMMQYLMFHSNFPLKCIFHTRSSIKAP